MPEYLKSYLKSLTAQQKQELLNWLDNADDVEGDLFDFIAETTEPIG